jgi:hypothetical protein
MKGNETWEETYQRIFGLAFGYDISNYYRVGALASKLSFFATHDVFKQILNQQSK